MLVDRIEWNGQNAQRNAEGFTPAATFDEKLARFCDLARQLHDLHERTGLGQEITLSIGIPEDQPGRILFNGTVLFAAYDPDALKTYFHTSKLELRTLSDDTGSMTNWIVPNVPEWGSAASVRCMFLDGNPYGLEPWTQAKVQAAPVGVI